MKFDMYKKNMDNIKAPDDLINTTVNKMNSAADTEPVRNKRYVFRMWTVIIAAVITISLLGIGVYAYSKGIRVDYRFSNGVEMFEKTVYLEPADDYINQETTTIQSDNDDNISLETTFMEIKTN